MFIFKLGINFSINQFFEVAVQVYLGSKLLDGHFNLLFNITENLCDAAEEAKKTNLATVVRPLWTEYTNVPFGCPFEPVSTNLVSIDFLFVLFFKFNSSSVCTKEKKTHKRSLGRCIFIFMIQQEKKTFFCMINLSASNRHLMCEL